MMYHDAYSLKLICLFACRVPVQIERCMTSDMTFDGMKVFFDAHFVGDLLQMVICLPQRCLAVYYIAHCPTIMYACSVVDW